MPSIGSITKTIRIYKNDLRVVEKIMEDEKASWSGAIHLIISGYKENLTRQDIMDRAVERDIKMECRKKGISTHDLFRGVSELFRKGRIYEEKGRIKLKGELDTERIEENSWKRGINPQELIDQIADKLRL